MGPARSDCCRMPTLVEQLCTFLRRTALGRHARLWPLAPPLAAQWRGGACLSDEARRGSGWEEGVNGKVEEVGGNWLAGYAFLTGNRHCLELCPVETSAGRRQQLRAWTVP